MGHDLRTPLAAAKASVSSLLSKDVDLGAEDRYELLVAADESLDKLAKLVDNLLDMSRLQSGALSIAVQPTAVDEVVARSLDDLGPDGRRVVFDSVADLPLVLADPGLLERVLANLLVNAVRYSPDGAAPHVTCSRLGDRVEIRVVDRGPGIPPDDWDRVFLPFQRLGDTDNTAGRRSRACPGPRAHRGDGRHPRARGDPGRWADHGRLRSPAVPGDGAAAPRPREREAARP